MNEQITVNLNNLTEEEREQFKTLVDKGRGKSSRESCVWKPKKGEVYYYINDYNVSIADFWNNVYVDKDRWKIGNIFKTEKEADFAKEKAKVKRELERYALEHNETLREKWDREGTYQHYSIVFDNERKKIVTTDAYFLQEESTTYFTSREIAYNAIEAVGKERILKYLFDVDCEEETND